MTSHGPYPLGEAKVVADKTSARRPRQAEVVFLVTGRQVPVLIHQPEEVDLIILTNHLAKGVNHQGPVVKVTVFLYGNRPTNDPNLVFAGKPVK